MPEVSEANAPAESVESEPATLVPEGAPGPSAASTEAGSAMMGSTNEPSSTGARAAYEEALKAKAAAIEAYIQAGIDKVAAAVGQTEIVTVAGFKAAVEALLRHLHADHPENYL